MAYMHPFEYKSLSDFKDKYELVVDQTKYSDREMLCKTIELAKDSIMNIKVNNNNKGKAAIHIELKN